jgi:hypothetical protein
VWCVTRPDLFAPALSQAGLKSDRVIYLEGGDEKTVLACFEEGLRHGGLGAVVAKVARLPMTAALDAAPRSWRRPAALARRADPMPRRRERGFRTGGVRRAAADRGVASCARPGGYPPRALSRWLLDLRSPWWLDSQEDVMVPRFDGHGGYAASLSACSGVL